jgi:hypothetical protein
MNRIAASLLFSAAVVSGSGSALLAQTPARPFSLWPHAKQAKESKTAIHDDAVELAAMKSRIVTVSTGPGSASGMANVQMVNSRGLVIDFDLKCMGPSGVGAVELYYTRNGQTWTKYQGEGVQTQSPFVVEVAEDGLYGFTVVASNGMGIGKAPPQPGDAPQMWVDVDTTRPEVRLINTQAGADENGRTLTLRWSAMDRNLVARPITLSYAERPQGPWIPFATNVENLGEYTWHMTSGMPRQVLVRVEATDRVGNTGADATAMPGPVDLTRPTASIRNVSRNGTIQQAGGHE